MGKISRENWDATYVKWKSIVIDLTAGKKNPSAMFNTCGYCTEFYRKLDKEDGCEGCPLLKLGLCNNYYKEGLAYWIASDNDLGIDKRLASARMLLGAIAADEPEVASKNG